MNVCVVGCGAIGSLFAAHLARLVGVDVYAYDIDSRHVEAINRQGLRLRGAAEFVSRPRAATDPNEIPACEFGLVVTKSMHTRKAIGATAHLFGRESAVCSLQNGAGNEEILAEHVDHVIRGTTFPAGHLLAPGEVSFDIAGETWIGPFEPSGTPMTKVRKLAELLTLAGMTAHALEDARGAQWTKLIFNAATNPVGALTRLDHGAASYFPPTAELFERLIEEGEAVARALGIELHGDPRDMVEKGAQAPGKHKASMLQDVEAARLTEVDFLNGAIVRRGRDKGVPTPLNQAMWALIKGLEKSYEAAT